MAKTGEQVPLFLQGWLRQGSAALSRDEAVGPARETRRWAKQNSSKRSGTARDIMARAAPDSRARSAPGSCSGYRQEAKAEETAALRRLPGSDNVRAETGEGVVGMATRQRQRSAEGAARTLALGARGRGEGRSCRARTGWRTPGARREREQEQEMAARARWATCGKRGRCNGEVVAGGTRRQKWRVGNSADQHLHRGAHLVTIGLLTAWGLSRPRKLNHLNCPELLGWTLGKINSYHTFKKNCHNLWSKEYSC